MSKVAIITGAGSGIGRATAIMLASRGWILTLVGRREQALRETEALLCGLGLTIPTDISAASGCETVISETEARFGRIDVLVNNAGTAPMASIDKTPPAVVDQVFGINALAPAYLIHYVWPIFLRQQAGCIVNVSTMGTIDPFPGFFAYAAAKASVNLMARSCSKEGKEHGIRAFAVAPGAVETDMLRRIVPESSLPRSRTLSPEAVAHVILDCIEGKRDSEGGSVIPIEPSV
jgi:NAD(P)-dependent dehydrogenase (short-subunit alcohol dehydrogenase family)